MKTAPVKTNGDNGNFSIISLTEYQEALSEGQFGKQMRDTYFVWSWHSRTKRWYWSIHVLGTLQIFFRDISLKKWNLTTVTSAQMVGVYGD